jgi:uncharacterized protein (TIGR01244 family)
MKNCKTIFAALVLLATVGCASTTHSPNVTKGEFADVPYVTRSKTYFMKQPTAEALTAAKAAGITTVINLRTNEEMKDVKFDAAATAKAQGLNYYHIPVDSKESVSKDVMAQIEDTYMKHHSKGEKVIVHCATGQRAAGWFAYHIKTRHNETTDNAIKEASEVGLSRPDLVEKIKAAIQ